MEQEASEGDEVEARQDGGQALIVACQAAEAGHPSKTPLEDPALTPFGRFGSVIVLFLLP